MKTQTKPKIEHTPGPWNHQNMLWIEDAQNRLIATVEWKNNQDIYPHTVGEEEAKANTYLIAAAPDLLEAAKRGVMALEANGAFNCEAAKELRAAIDKAEGK